MSARVFLAGASSAVGRRLIPLLRRSGSTIFGTTRSAARADELRSMGIEPIVIDVFDAPALTRAVVVFEPTVVIHQLTDLALIRDPTRLEEALSRNARVRIKGTKNLVAAALAAALAVDWGAPGIYNIAEPSASVSVEKAQRELGWDPYFRLEE
jgi:nucleoside-diphosphate-sugar epimerase